MSSGPINIHRYSYQWILHFCTLKLQDIILLDGDGVDDGDGDGDGE